MLLIKDENTLRTFLPNAFASVEGEVSLFDKLQPWLQIGELWLQQKVLILEKTRLEQHAIYLDSRISFSEIDQYFFSGCACAYFQVAVDVYTDLRYNQEEWE